MGRFTVGVVMKMDSVEVGKTLFKLLFNGNLNKLGLMIIQNLIFASLAVDLFIQLSLMVINSKNNFILDLGRLFTCGKGDSG